MKHIKKLLAFVFIIITLALLSIKVLGEEKQLKLKLLWSKDFPGGRKLNINETGECVVVVEEKKPNSRPTQSVYLVNERGEIAQTMKLEHKVLDKTKERAEDTEMFISSNGLYWGKLTTYYDEKTGKSKKSEMTLMKQNGEVISVCPISGPAVISNDGKHYVCSVGGPSIENALKPSYFYFYDSFGTLLNKTNEFQELGAPYHYGFGYTFSEDGKFFVAYIREILDHTLEYPKIFDDSNFQSFLVLFHSNGQEIWRQPLKGNSDACVRTSFNGDIIVATDSYGLGDELSIRKNYIYFFDKKGNAIKEVETGNKQSDWLCINSISHYTGLISDNRILSVYNSRNGNLLWEWSDNSPNFKLCSADISSQGEVVAIGVIADNWSRVSEGRIYIFDKTGKIIYQNVLSENFESGISPLNPPAPKFVKNDQNIIISFGSGKIRCFQVSK